VGGGGQRDKSRVQAFNSLFEMQARPPHENLLYYFAPFNSLFEMLIEVVRVGESEDVMVLSILYLRCT